MPDPPSVPERLPISAGIFATTHWSVVLAAQGTTHNPSAETAAALNELCQAYWYPLYAYIRRRGYDPHQGQDLTQEFFARLLRKGDALQADPRRGKFRFYLLGALKHFLADMQDHAAAQKRGGGAAVISFEQEAAEERYRLEPVDQESPEKLFERRWALTLLDQAANRLRAEHVAAGKAELYDGLEPFLGAGDCATSYEEAARDLGLSASAVKSAIHRLRRRHRELVREEVARTVNNPSEVEEEIRHLISVMS